VRADGLGNTVSSRPAELGVSSPVVEDFARAVRNGDWSTVHPVGEQLSVDVAIAA
jgi:hypothetical protein